MESLVLFLVRKRTKKNFYWDIQLTYLTYYPE